MEPEISRKSDVTTDAPRITRIRPPCCTTNCTLRSVGSWTTATGEVKPLAWVRNLNCASRWAAPYDASSATAIAPRIRIRIAYTRALSRRLLRPMRCCHRPIVSASTSALFLALALACGKSAPSPPQVTPPSTGETINGTDRIGWTQRAGDAVELSTVRFAVYVDGVRAELPTASCDAS